MQVSRNGWVQVFMLFFWPAESARPKGRVRPARVGQERVSLIGISRRESAGAGVHNIANENDLQ
jgi:hypothetical protein